MAPVFSKIRSSIAYSPGGHQSLDLPTQLGPVTIAQLTDDSLLVLLSLLPLSHLLSQVQLTCKRLHALLPCVLRQRRSLLLYSDSDTFLLYHAPFLAYPSRRVTPLIYASFLSSFFDTTKEFVSLNAPASRDSGLQLSPNVDLPIPAQLLSQIPPLLRHLNDSFPNLTHLILGDPWSSTELLLHLLRIYRHRLQSLSLRSYLDAERWNTLCSAIDSMTSLRRLVLLDARHLNLPTVLPRLTSFSLIGLGPTPARDQNPLPILEKLDGEQLTQLHLSNWEKGGEYSFMDLLASKPTFGRSLTHLALARRQLYSANNCITLQQLKLIVTRCTRLRHLDISLDGWTVLAKALPYLSKLPRLTSLGLHSVWDLFSINNSPKHRPDKSLLKAPPLVNLRVLNLAICIKNPRTLSLLPTIFPNLQQLYLDGSYLDVGDLDIPLNTDSSFPKDDEKLAVSPERAALLAVLNSLPFMPQIGPFPDESIFFK